MIRLGCDQRHACSSLVPSIVSEVAGFVEVTWKHISREANGCTDALANYGHSVSHGLHVFDRVPTFLSFYLLLDLTGLLSFRHVTI